MLFDKLEGGRRRSVPASRARRKIETLGRARDRARWLRASERSGASPATRRFISERTRQNANTSHVTAKAPTITPTAIRANFVADTSVDISSAGPKHSATTR